MKTHMKNTAAALLCFAAVMILNFALPRMLPGDPVAYLSGFAEEDMTAAQVERYRSALHLDEPVLKQFGYYLGSIADGTLGYSFKKEASVSSLIASRIPATLQIALPALVISSALGLYLGLAAGSRRDSALDRAVNAVSIGLNAVPGFAAALGLMLFFCFRHRWLPYSGLNSPEIAAAAAAGRVSAAAFLADRVRHLALPVTALTLGILPSRCLLVRNTAAEESGKKYVLYARQRGLAPGVIRRSYILKNIAQPFIVMTGLSVGSCVGGSLVVENIFSINGMGRLLTDAVYTLDYPLMQGILFVTAGAMTAAIILSDIVCALADPMAGRRNGDG